MRGLLPLRPRPPFIVPPPLTLWLSQRWGRALHALPTTKPRPTVRGLFRRQGLGCFRAPRHCAPRFDLLRCTPLAPSGAWGSLIFVSALKASQRETKYSATLRNLFFCSLVLLLCLFLS